MVSDTTASNDCQLITEGSWHEAYSNSVLENLIRELLLTLSNSAADLE